ncbi:MAG TPA: glycoside hydrolase family 2 TIM barrel-domain containing protein [Anaerolineae bacterium]|nr:glycoside hydrolase family 2 TIM barrel-domain containing protein [Anaerolineae bacterium]HQH39517.1 glycoside hydrolase family 2 TIM barrel-domain containing protein [Anaerolineae bacterium]
MTTIPILPRPEYPRPQFRREPWINLNGPWTYTFDSGKSGAQRGFAHSNGFDGVITVPFCPESPLSGVNHKDFIEMMWYQRPIHIPTDWAGKRVILHFGAVDYESEAFIDGESVGRHWGGTASFSYDITAYVTPGRTHNLVVYVRDDVRSGQQPSGKQCPDFKSRDCHYTRTTGIWQTVWLEAVPEYGLRDCQIVPDVDNARFIITPRFYALKAGLRFRATLQDGTTVVGQAETVAANGIPLILPMASPKLWSPASPFLYDLIFEVLDGDTVMDTVQSYAGLRKIHLEGKRILLNNEPLYLRLVLDQGFYPDGIWTAPTDDALKHDIELALAAGFNGARLHQKVFEERFHYWADRLGYLTWGESSSWGIDVKDVVGARNFLAEWREIVTRDRNHPSIIAWTPFNETHDTGDKRQHYRLHRDAAQLARDLDPTRPVNDASGYVHVDTDLWTVHTYEQNPNLLRDQLKPHPQYGPFRNFPDREVAYAGQPYLVDEYGGIKWIPRADLVYAENSWGYGNAPQTLEEFYARLEGLTDVLLSYDHIVGFCYTQLTDIEQEQNGIYNYDRTEKFDMARIKAIFTK